MVHLKFFCQSLKKYLCGTSVLCKTLQRKSNVTKLSNNNHSVDAYIYIYSTSWSF